MHTKSPSVTQMKRSILVAGVVAGMTLLAPSLSGQTTAFTYQGRLDAAGSPASGLHDFRFALFDAAEGGQQVGDLLCADDVDVVDGLFTVILDFDQQFATPQQRHLEIEVRRDTGLNCSNAAGFVELVPRQEITAAPIASHATSAFALHAPDGSPKNAVFVDNDGKVGIGTTTPVVKLDVRGGPMLVENVGDEADLLWLASERSWVFRQEGVGAETALKLQSIGGGGNKNFVIQTDGFVGIGTTTPTTKLFVVSASSNAIFGSTSAPGLIGVTGVSTGGSGGIGVRGTGLPPGFGVFAVGNLGASGNKSFRIDHPLDPEHKFLRHYCSEGPEPLNVYGGTVTTNDNGFASVILPDYFESINRDPRVQLTVEDASDDFVLVKVVGPVRDGVFALRTSKPHVKVYWEVKAVRNDLWVQRYGAPVEEDKPAAEHGLYQHPELYGLSAEFEMSNGVVRAEQAGLAGEGEATDAHRSRNVEPAAPAQIDPR